MAEAVAGAPAADPAPTKTSWTDVAMTGLHYLAGGAILGGTGYLTTLKIVDGQVFVGLLLAAAAAVGFKLKS
jgi:hypothetical protein